MNTRIEMVLELGAFCYENGITMLDLIQLIKDKQAKKDYGWTD